MLLLMKRPVVVITMGRLRFTEFIQYVAVWSVLVNRLFIEIVCS